MAPFGKFHWFAWLSGFVVLIAFGYLNLRYIPNVAVGWPRVCYLVRDNNVIWDSAEFRLSSLTFDVVLLLFTTIGTVLTTNRWLRHGRLRLTLSLNLAAISALATYFAMFPGFVGSVQYAVQELAIAIVFAAILISWIGLFNWLSEKLRMRAG